MSELTSKSYMEMRLDLDGKSAVFLRIPTFWDEIEKQWIGMIKTPASKKLIVATGKDDFELQNNFNVEISKWFHDPKYSVEIFNMFKAKEYWERNCNSPSN